MTPTEINEAVFALIDTESRELPSWEYEDLLHSIKEDIEARLEGFEE